MSASYVSLASIIIIALVATAGVWCKSYNDNLLQRCGLVLIIWVAVARLSQWAANPATSWLEALGHAGLALYALGTARKVWAHRPRQAWPVDPGVGARRRAHRSTP